MSLQVPELTIEEFLQECLSLGSYLTLYVYLLQCLNSEQTLRNEMKVLLLLSKWLEQVYPRWVGPPAAVLDSLGLDHLESRVKQVSISVHRPRETNKRGCEVQGHFLKKDFLPTRANFLSRVFISYNWHFEEPAFSSLISSVSDNNVSDNNVYASRAC